MREKKVEGVIWSIVVRLPNPISSPPAHILHRPSPSLINVVLEEILSLRIEVLSRIIYDNIVSVLDQNEGGIGKSIPDAREIS